ncbi:RHS repeat-associated core domain-containing protein, partial [Thermoflexus sp.]|uniref:RHS repeat-associated core domain-containing protein n=1 Tax=Thermoflexus sp. TaxID=1969742 RepID=UPI002ADE40BF
GLFPTDRRFTGQRWETSLRLYDDQARFYDPALGRFLQPDPIVPEPGNPQALNRYAYVYNNPLRYTDPSGHCALLEEQASGLCVRFTPEGTLHIVQGGSVFVNWVEVALANALLSGNPRYLGNLPNGAGWAIAPSLSRVRTELEEANGEGSTRGLGLDPLWLLGLAMAAGKAGEDPAGPPPAWLELVPPKYRETVARAFQGTPQVITLQEDLIVYRHWGGGAQEVGSPWFSPKPYTRPGNARRYLALPPGNTAEQISVFKIPAGTTILRGKVAPQIEYFGPYAVGGGEQIYLPDPSKAILIGPLDVNNK